VNDILIQIRASTTGLKSPILSLSARVAEEK
jgi:hypothetical protein